MAMAILHTKYAQKRRRTLRAMAPVARIALVSCVAIVCHQPALVAAPMPLSIQTRIKQVDAAKPMAVVHSASQPAVRRSPPIAIALWPRTTDNSLANWLTMLQIRVAQLGGLYGP